MRLAQMFKTGIFFAALTAVLVVTGYFIGGAGGAILFLFVSAASNLVMYWFSSSIALSMSGAHEVPAGELQMLRHDMAELCTAMSIPVPKLYLSPEMQPNAFATGRNPSHSAVCFTQGILQALNRDELRGVLAHELSHIKNRDVFLSTVAAVIAGAVSSIAQIGFFFGGNDEERNTLVDILVMILAPVTATIVQLAISRSREYLADSTAAKYTNDPASLARALEKIHAYSTQIPMNSNPALSSLYIANPFSGSTMMSLFSTHPPVEKRIEKLLSGV